MRPTSLVLVGTSGADLKNGTSARAKPRWHQPLSEKCRWAGYQLLKSLFRLLPFLATLRQLTGSSRQSSQDASRTVSYTPYAVLIARSEIIGGIAFSPGFRRYGRRLEDFEELNTNHHVRTVRSTRSALARLLTGSWTRCPEPTPPRPPPVLTSSGTACP